MTGTEESILRIRGVSKSFSGVEVLHGVDLDLAPASVHAIWYAENARGRLHYVTKKALHRHPFQHDPAYGRDLPYDIPAAADPDAVAK